MQRGWMAVVTGQRRVLFSAVWDVHILVTSFSGQFRNESHFSSKTQTACISICFYLNGKLPLLPQTASVLFFSPIGFNFPLISSPVEVWGCK